MKCLISPESNLRAICMCIVYCFIVHVHGGRLTKKPYNPIQRSLNLCPESDHCYYGNGTEISSPAPGKSCACDVECGKSEDCCIDAANSSATHQHGMKCIRFKRASGAYMINKCPDTYNGDERWKRLCENSDEYDFMRYVPVTDTNTSETYRNIYCGLCNGKFYYSRFWTVEFLFPYLSYYNESHLITDDFIWENFMEKDGQWVLNVHGIKGVAFHPCLIFPAIPSDFQSRVRLCNSRLQSDCPSSWEDEITRQKCKSFLGPRFTHEGVGYRNVYCAICNNEVPRRLLCESPPVRDFWERRILLKVGKPYSLFLDVIVEEADGMFKLCKPGEASDPLSRQCKELQCLPGYVKHGNKCFPQTKWNKWL